MAVFEIVYYWRVGGLKGLMNDVLFRFQRLLCVSESFIKKNAK